MIRIEFVLDWMLILFVIIARILSGIQPTWYIFDIQENLYFRYIPHAVLSLIIYEALLGIHSFYPLILTIARWIKQKLKKETESRDTKISALLSDPEIHKLFTEFARNEWSIGKIYSFFNQY